MINPRMNKPRKINPHCPVPGCKTDKPHSTDPIVAGLIGEFSRPERMTHWVLGGMAELRNSIVRDMKDGQIFAWYTRLRQPEELYVRTLYALFVAGENELHHVLSGDMPNGLSTMYIKVNDIIFEGRGKLLTTQPGLEFGSFTAMDTLNDGAHASFAAFTTCISLVHNPEHFPQNFIEQYAKHLTTYCDYLNYMHGMFNAGKSRSDVLEGVRSLHKPASYWKEQQEVARHQAISGERRYNGAPLERRTTMTPFLSNEPTQQNPTPAPSPTPSPGPTPGGGGDGGGQGGGEGGGGTSAP
jgi:hypothetical protein